MRHAFDSKGKVKDSLRNVDSQPNWREHRFANSAYRTAKQRGFFTSDDVFKSLEADENFCERMNLPSFLSVAKRG